MPRRGALSMSMAVVDFCIPARVRDALGPPNRRPCHNLPNAKAWAAALPRGGAFAGLKVQRSAALCVFRSPQDTVARSGVAKWTTGASEKYGGNLEFFTRSSVQAPGGLRKRHARLLAGRPRLLPRVAEGLTCATSIYKGLGDALLRPQDGSSDRRRSASGLGAIASSSSSICTAFSAATRKSRR